MTIQNYIILSIINTITTILPISNNAHIHLLKNIFETNIFNHPSQFYITINIGITISIIYVLKNQITYNKKIISKENLIKLKTLLFIIITSIIPIISTLLLNKITPIFYTQTFLKKVTPLMLIINAIILLIINKNNYNKIKIKLHHLIFINIVNCFSIIPGISNISLTLLSTYILKYSKQQSLIITLLTTLFYSLYMFITTIQSLNYEPYIYLICILTTTITSKIVINYFIRLLNKNKLNKIAIYLIFLATFILFWFR